MFAEEVRSSERAQSLRSLPTYAGELCRIRTSRFEDKLDVGRYSSLVSRLSDLAVAATQNVPGRPGPCHCSPRGRKNSQQRHGGKACHARGGARAGAPPRPSPRIAVSWEEAYCEAFQFKAGGGFSVRHFGLLDVISCQHIGQKRTTETSTLSGSGQGFRILRIMHAFSDPENTRYRCKHAGTREVGPGFVPP